MNATTKQRYISTSIWYDDWFDSLSEREQLFYLYLLTSPHSNAAGVFQCTLKTIRMEKNLDHEEVVRIMNKFSEDGKAYYIRDWVIIPKWLKHQKAAERNGILLGALKVLKSLPDDIKAFLLEDRKHYDWDISSIGVPPPKKDSATPLPPSKNKGVSIKFPVETGVPLEKTAHDSDLDLDSEFDSDSDRDIDRDLDLEAKTANSLSEKPVYNYRPPPKDLHSFVKEKVKAHGYFIDDPVVKKIINSTPDISWLYVKYNIIDFAAGKIEEVYSEKPKEERKKLLVSALTKWENIFEEYPVWVSKKIKADEDRAYEHLKKTPPDNCPFCGFELKGLRRCDKCKGSVCFDEENRVWVYEKYVEFNLQEAYRQSIRDREESKKANGSDLPTEDIEF